MLRVKKIFLIAGFYLLTVAAYSQKNDTDNPVFTLLNTKNDTNKINNLLKRSYAFELSNTDSALYYLDSCKMLIDKYGLSTQLIACYRGYVSIYNITSQFQKGLDYSGKILELAIKTNDKKNIALGYKALAINYQGLNQFQTAVKFSLLSIAYSDSINDNTPDLRYENISWIYNDLKEYDKAIYYGEKGIAIAKKANFTLGWAKCLNNTGIAYAALFNHKQAAACFNEQLRIAASAGNKNEYILALIGLCKVHYATGNTNMLHKYYLALLAEQKTITDIHDLSMMEEYFYTGALVNIADGQLADAENKILKGFEVCKKDTYARQLIMLCELYSHIKFAQRDFAASDYYKFKADSIETSLVTLQLLGNTQDLEVKYETKKKEAEILKNNIETRLNRWIISAMACGMLAIAAIGFVQFRNSQGNKKLAVKQQELAIAEERIRIASDMHDDVGAGLVRIRYIIAAVKEGIHLSKSDMNKIVSLSDDAVEKMNEIIWSLNQGNQQLTELIYHIRSQCAEMVTSANIEFLCELPEIIPAVSFGWKENRNIYLLVKESVNNAIKHAGAGIIGIDILINEKLNITVHDNGRGFDTNSIRVNANGLQNYQKRVAALKGTCVVKSIPGAGVTILFSIPLS